MTSNVSYFCGPVWDKQGGGVSSHLHSVLCPQVKSRGQELSVIPREKAQSSCCSAPGLSPVQQQSTTMQPKRVPKLKMFYVIYPVTSLWRVPGFPSPLLPFSLSLVLTPPCPSFSRFPPSFGRRRGWRLVAPLTGAAQAVPGRRGTCPGVRLRGQPRCSLSPVISR